MAQPFSMRSENTSRGRVSVQAVVLCGGRGRRLRPITDTIPKPLVKVAGREIIRSSIEGLLDIGISDVTFVVKYLAKDVEDFVRNNYEGNFLFVPQIDAEGTGAAILSAKNIVSDEFVMLYGDNIFSNGSIRRLVEAPGDGAVGVSVSLEPERYGCVELNENNTVSGIVEKPRVPATNLVVQGGFRLQPEIMRHLSNISLSARGELEIPDAVNLSIKDGAVYSCAQMDGTIDLASLADIERYESRILNGPDPAVAPLV